MDAIYKELPNDIQQDINNLYHRNVPYLEELKRFGKVVSVIEYWQEKRGKGWMLANSDEWCEEEDDLYMHPIYRSRSEEFWCNIVSLGKKIGVYLIQLDVDDWTTIEEFYYLADEWEEDYSDEDYE